MNDNTDDQIQPIMHHYEKFHLESMNDLDFLAKILEVLHATQCAFQNLTINDKVIIQTKADRLHDTIYYTI